MRNSLFLLLVSSLVITACKNDNPSESDAKLVFRVHFDSTQQRLNNLGMPSTMAAGHAGQNPKMDRITAHYIEITPTALTQLGSGTILYHAPETSVGGTKAIDFTQSKFAKEGEVLYEAPIKDIPKGEYEYLRVSLAYQNYDVKMYIDTTLNGVSVKENWDCTIASFVGYNTYITTHTVKQQSLTVNGNRAQGYWGAETYGSVLGFPFRQLSSGQAPAGATTVVNPIATTSPIPAGSCVVTAAFKQNKLKITGTETEDIVVDVNLSTNKSFEWVENVVDGKWEPAKGEAVVDMGIRGMIPTIR